MTVKNHHSKAARESHQGHTEQKAMVSLNRIAEPGHVAENRGEHGGRGQNAARPAQTRDQQANGGKQFPNPLTPAPPGLGPHFAKDVNRLGCGGEFEEKCFDHDASRDELTSPAHDTLTRSECIGGYGTTTGARPPGRRGRFIGFEIFQLRERSIVSHVFGLPRGENLMVVPNR